jgi:hypothetical protein
VASTLAAAAAAAGAGVSRFLPTSRRLVQFSEGKFAPEGATIVYIDGAFDVFHVGHVEILEVRLVHGAAHLAPSYVMLPEAMLPEAMLPEAKNAGVQSLATSVVCCVHPGRQHLLVF